MQTISVSNGQLLKALYTKVKELTKDVKDLKDENTLILAKVVMLEGLMNEKKTSQTEGPIKYEPTKAEIALCKILEVPLEAYIDNVNKRLEEERRGPGRPRGRKDTKPRRSRKTIGATNKSTPLTKRTGTGK